MASPKAPASPPKAAANDAPSAPADTVTPSAGIEVDERDAETDYPESLVASSTESLRSSLLQYKWENGRRYHADQGDSSYYWGSNDDTQQDAEDLMHEMMRIIIDGKLTTAPIGDNVQKVLDLGCGTGSWACDFGDENPSSEVIGVDISPIQPGFVPPNCRFEVDDFTKDWTFAENSFDFIHMRLLTGCIQDWEDFYAKAFRHLKPGGWTEHIDYTTTARSDDGTIGPDSCHHTWRDMFLKMGAALGKSFEAAEISAECARKAGFINVHERRIKVPIGTWPKDPVLKQRGAWHRRFLLDGLEGFSIRGMTELLGWSYEEAQLVLVKVRDELNDPKVHAYLELGVITAQKPEEKETKSS